MGLNKRLIGAGATASSTLTPSEHFGVALYEGDGSTSHSINGGKFGAAAYFAGDSVIDTGLSTINFVSDLNDRTVDFSFSCWAQIHSYPQGDNTIFYIGNYNVYSPSYAAIILDFRSASKKIRFTHQTQYIESTSTFNAPMTTWVHIAAVRDNSVLKLYINGSLEASVTLTADTQVSSSTTLDIGGFQFGAGTIYSDFIGKMDQVRVFQKALSSSEVSTLYAETVETVESLDPLSEDTTDTLQVLGDTSCIATYRFENDETDLSGNYDGTGTEIQYAAGRYGQAASFNGTASTITNSIDLDDYGETWSISYWVKFTFNSSYRTIMGDTDNSVFNGFVSDIGTSGELRFRLRNATGSVSPLTSTGTYGDGNWHHVVCVKGSSTNYLYIDGTLDSSIATTTGINHNGTFTMGTFGNTAATRFKGELDQVRIFNKELSASEVTTLYQENSLVASYRFEGNANDDTRNYDGTASNVTYEYGLGFTPDFIWAKDRVATGEWHMLSDSTRGTNSQLFSNVQNPQDTKSTVIQSFDTGGFTVGSDNLVNNNGNDYVAWCWKANGGTTTSGTGTGSISNVTHQLNSDAGFCITKFTVPNTSTGGSTTT
ncbi:MAG: LamG domain-containing protein, partial [Flavobacteriaceae bacterium]|nr:LamG domain-containing protein [Flavobacteriaceae bacterium]